MKVSISILLFTLYTAFAAAQNVTRQKGEDKDSLIAKALGKHRFKAGNSYEINDSNSSIIIFFEIKNLKSLRREFEPSEGRIHPVIEYIENPYTGIATATLFEILYSTDGVNYAPQVIDTLDLNSGCCPCHLPDVVDTILFVDEKSYDDLILIKKHPVRYDCNSISSYKALFYHPFVTNLHKEMFNMQAFYTYNSLGSHLYEQVYLEMKKAFKEEKLKY